MASWIKKIFFAFAGRPSFQGFFSLFQRAVLLGMGVGTGADCSTSGEKHALEYAKRKLTGIPPSLIFFDVGANEGAYSKLIAKVFGKKAHIFSFEPSRTTFNRLAENMRGIDTVTVENVALGDKEGTTTLFTAPGNSKLGSLYKRQLAHFNRELSAHEVVRVETLDGFSARHRIAAIDFLKLDVEGNELACLRGSRLLTDGKIRFIQFEFGGSNIDSKSYFQDFWYLLSDTYRIYRILPHGLYEIRKYREEDEIFLTTNYLAELKTP